jgi:hypothetical protein
MLHSSIIVLLIMLLYMCAVEQGLLEEVQELTELVQQAAESKVSAQNDLSHPAAVTASDLQSFSKKLEQQVRLHDSRCSVKQRLKGSSANELQSQRFKLLPAQTVLAAAASTTQSKLTELRPVQPGSAPPVKARPHCQGTATTVVLLQRTTSDSSAAKRKTLALRSTIQHTRDEQFLTPDEDKYMV